MATPTQIQFRVEELWDAVPEGQDLPDTIKFRGMVFTVEQASAIYRTIRNGVEVTAQRMTEQRLAVRTALGPAGIWMVYEPDGSFDYTPEVKKAMRGAS